MGYWLVMGCNAVGVVLCTRVGNVWLMVFINGDVGTTDCAGGARLPF